MTRLEIQPGITIDMPARQMRSSHRDSLEYSTVSQEPTFVLPDNPRRAWIPREYLFGAQKRKQYRPESERRVVDGLVANPVGFLENNPVVVVALPTGKNNTSLVLEDGHHRVRYSGRVKSQDKDGRLKTFHKAIPSLVFTPEEIADILNCNGEGPYTPETYIDRRLVAMSEVLAELDSFALHRQPQPLVEITDVNEIVLLFGKPPSRQIFPAV